MNPAGMFGRVAVVMGGQSSERHISIRSGRRVLEALKSRGVDAYPVDGLPALLDALRAGHFSRVFNLLHGASGENGELQGALDALGVPYTGSGILGSALSLDKLRAKKIWLASGLPTPAFEAVGCDTDIDAAGRRLGFPLIVKPSREGSSLGITVVDDPSKLGQAVELAKRHAGVPLLEAFIDGEELTVLILGRRVMPSVRILAKTRIYDFVAKYESEDTRYECPALTGHAETELGELALAAFDALDCSGWGRVDVMRDTQGALHLLEINTAPGMTSHSLTPKAAEAVGLSFDELVWQVLQQTL
jgi:D-alanine-D-alanine ligase